MTVYWFTKEFEAIIGDVINCFSKSYESFEK